MIFYDMTKSGSVRHQSGLTRVSSRLREELGSAAVSVAWPGWNRAAGKGDWFFTAELFSPAERPGFREFVIGRSCRCAAVFYDAIPLKHPHITWPRSVGRHPAGLKFLADFDRVWAISEASRAELLGYWRWLGIASPPPVDVLALGADFDRAPRSGARSSAEASAKADSNTRDVMPSFAKASSFVKTSEDRSAGDAEKRGRPPLLLCIGILEPRKNQSFLLDVCAELWAEGLKFDLHLVGRVNPHFGRPIVAKIKALGKKYSGLHHHAAADDGALARLFSAARATVFPTIAEGSGLPLLESLWKGVPCVGSDLPALRENAAAGGCRLVAPGDGAAWKRALRDVLADDILHARLATEARSRPLPTWADAAGIIRSATAS